MTPDLIASLLTLLQAGGNTAMIVLVVIMWKFDRRLVRIETQLAMRRLITDPEGAE